MALDFPNNPVNGQLFASGGMTWRFDSTKWTETAGTLALADAPSDGNTYGRRNTAWNSVDAMLAPVAANANAALNDSGRNLLHNGQFNVNQRAWAAGALPVSTLGYGFDRWIFQTQGSDTGTTAIITMADSDRSAIGDEAAEVGFSWALAGASAANSSSNFQQRIEDVRRLGGKIVTTSFWARALSGTPSVGLSMVQIFGSGGSPSPTVITGIGKVTLTANWARYTLTGTVPSTSGKTLGSTANTSFTTVTFVLSDVSNVYGTGVGQQASGTVAFYGIQLELGSVATPLAKRDPQQELALCQRFYQTSGTPLLVYGYNGAGGFVISTFTYPVTMRANPTVAFSSVSYTNASAIQANGSSNNYGLSVQITASAAGTAYANYSVTASADL